jgi:hypothetical protein
VTELPKDSNQETKKTQAPSSNSLQGLQKKNKKYATDIVLF